MGRCRCRLLTLTLLTLFPHLCEFTTAGFGPSVGTGDSHFLSLLGTFTTLAALGAHTTKRGESDEDA